MAKRKKVILLIVEGITDKTCLGFALSKILNSNIVEFQLINGDITCETGINSSNIAEKVGRIVKEFSDPFSFKALDFLEIVHLVDMDGAYVADNQIVQRTPETPVDPSDRKKLYYGDNQIFVNNIVSIQKRNQQKTSIINRLISMKKVWRTIPYSVYFFSCNLDHTFMAKETFSRMINLLMLTPTQQNLRMEIRLSNSLISFTLRILQLQEIMMKRGLLLRPIIIP